MPQSTATIRRAPRSGQRAHRLDIRPVAFEQAVGDIDDGIESGPPQKKRGKRARGGAVDIVVAEHGDAFAALGRVGKPRRGCFHRCQDMRVWHQPADRRIEIVFDGVRLDVAPGEDAGKQFRHAAALNDGERALGSAFIEPVAPRAPGRGALDAEKGAGVQVSR